MKLNNFSTKEALEIVEKFNKENRYRDGGAINNAIDKLIEIAKTYLSVEGDLYVNINRITGEDLYRAIKENMLFGETMELYRKLKDVIEDRVTIETTEFFANGETFAKVQEDL